MTGAAARGAPAVAEALALLGPLARADEPIGARTTYRVGGVAAVYVEARSTADLGSVARAVQATGLEVLVLGGGSNLLVADEGFAGICVRLDGAGFSQVAIDGASAAVVAGGAALLPVVARRSVAAGLTGFEWAVGVPGTVGGAVRMNAGGHGADMARSLVGIRVVDCRTGEDVVVPAASLDLGYRRSSVAPHQVVVEATLRLAPGDPALGEAALAEVVRWRREHQPGGQNAGSVFANPPGESAGRLVESVGAKGLRIGTAQVSPKHANFFQADPGGRAADLHALMVEVHRRVLEGTGVDLRTETRLVGFAAPGAAPHAEAAP